MATSADNKTTFLFFEKLSRSQRKLLYAFTLILVIVFAGLSFVLSQFVDFTSRTSKQFSASTGRDTLIVESFHRSLEVYRVAQLAQSNPAKRDSLQPLYQRAFDRLDLIRQKYLGLLAYARTEDRALLLQKFNAFWSHVDALFARTKYVFEGNNARTRGKANVLRDRESIKRASENDEGGFFFIDNTEFYQPIQARFDELLNAELKENDAQVSASRQLIQQIGYRWFLIAFLLFGLGAMLAFILTKQGKDFQEGTRRFRTLLDYSINPIQVVSSRGRVLYANPAYERWSGVSRAELVDQPAYAGVKLLNQSNGGRDFWELVSPILKAGKAWSGDVEIDKKPEGRIFTLLIISPVLDASGQLIECISIHHDVTERRELARKFEESQEKYQDIVESSLDGIVIVQDGKLVFVNSSAIKIFAYESAEEMKTLSFTDTVAPASRFFVLEGYQGRLIGEDILRNYEIKGLTKQGKIIDLEVSAKLVSWNGRTAVQASFRDITERKVLEREQALWLWEQETMSTIDRQLVSSVDLRVVLDTISHHAKVLTRADWAGVMMVDLTAVQALWRAAKGNKTPLPQESFQLGKAMVEVAKSNDPMVMQDLGINPRFPIDEFPPFKEENIVSAARFPLIVEKEIRGQLVIGYRQHHEFSPREIRLLSSLAEKSSIALANAQLYDNLLSRERDLELLSGARVKAQEEERRRIAREIHDSLGQLLTAIKFNVEIFEDVANLQGSDERQRIEDIKSLLDNAMNEAREISYNLMPSVLVDFGLTPALQLLCEQFSKRDNLRIIFHSNGVDKRLDPTMEIGLYRIAQEALNNVAKHAEAQEVNVQLIGDAQTIRLTIDDNGKGFYVTRLDVGKSERHGMGLVSMRERAASFNGVFTLDSKLGRGTEIVVEIPLTNLSDDGQN